MKTKFVIGLIALSLLTLSVAAENDTSQEQAMEKGPGMIGPGSFAYGLETAWDNAAIDIGLKRAGDVAQERAAEVQQAMERNNTKGAQRATKNLERTAEKAQERDEEGIERAIQMMNRTMQNAPNEEARQGMQTALNNMKEAQEKRQEARQKSTNSSEQNQQPDNPGERPENTGEKPPSEPQDIDIGSQNTTAQQEQETNTTEGSNEQTSENRP